MTTKTQSDRGERYALHSFGSQVIVPAAAASSRAVFEACGGAPGWKSWIMPDGKMIKNALALLAKFIDDHPDAPAEAAYIHLRRFPGFIGRHDSWAEAPMQVRGAYEAFRAVYLQLWVMVRKHDATMARALPPRPLPRLVNSDMHERAMQPDNAGRLGTRERLHRNFVRLPPSDHVPASEDPGDGAA